MKHMSCMEVWGGNQAMDGGVIMAGLDAWIYSRPWRDALAGGDVHYVSSCASGRITRFVVGDISGHGVAVSELSAKLRRRMRRFVNHLDQRRFVRQLNSEFGQLSRAGIFATAVVGTFFAPNRFLTVCNAGHPPPLYYNRRRGIWTLLEDLEREEQAANLPLGVVGEMRYHELGLRLEIGDLLMLYTDSLLERGGRTLKPAELCGSVEQLDIAQPETLVRRVIEAVGGNHHEGDDLTVLLIRPNGMSPQFPLRERLRAPVVFLRDWLGRLGRGESAAWPDLRLANVGGAMIPWFNRFWGRRGNTVRRLDEDD